VVQYRQHLEQQQSLAQQNAALLQQQKRVAQYRSQEQYFERVRQQQIHLRDDRFDYNRDPYFYTAPIYRYNRGGSYYETNEYGAKTLRQAVTMATKKASAPERQTGTTVGVPTTKTLMPIGTQTTAIVAIM
jgi:hypothetical protein